MDDDTYLYQWMIEYANKKKLNIKISKINLRYSFLFIKLKFIKNNIKPNIIMSKEKKSFISKKK